MSNSGSSGYPGSLDRTRCQIELPPKATCPMLSRRSLFGLFAAAPAAALFTLSRRFFSEPSVEEGAWTRGAMPDDLWCHPCREKGRYHFVTFTEGGVILNWECPTDPHVEG